MAIGKGILFIILKDDIELSFISFKHFIKFSEFFAFLKSAQMSEIPIELLPLFQVCRSRFISLSITEMILEQIVITKKFWF